MYTEVVTGTDTRSLDVCSCEHSQEIATQIIDSVRGSFIAFRIYSTGYSQDRLDHSIIVQGEIHFD
jgi:hypothetical protein